MLERTTHLQIKPSLDLMREIPVSLKSRIIRPFFKADTRKVRSFFATYRRRPEEVAITDFSTGHFSNVLLNEIRTLRDPPFELCIDLGCGSSNLRQICSQPVWNRYIGTDLLIDEAMPASSSDVLVEHDLSVGLPRLPETESTLLVAVNVLCYMENIAPLMSDIAKRSGRRSVLILEPHPSILWESAFHGFRLFYRSYGELLSHFARNSKTITRTKVNLGVPGFRGWTASNLLHIELSSQRT
jgi:hypothetical protein